MKPKPIIAIAADDAALADALQAALPHASIIGFNSTVPADLVIIEGAARKALRTPDMPTILLAGEDEKAAPARDLSITLTKPLKLYDVLAAIHMLLTRAEKLRHREIMLSPTIQFLPVEKLVRDIKKKQSVALTEKETDILYALHQAPLAREGLLEKIWGYGEQISTHTLETHIYRLRTKLKPLLGDKSGIATTESGYLIDF